MKPWLETIRLPHPLRQASLVQTTSTGAMDDTWLREREQTAYERGRQEGERALSEQLLRQRTELIELQNGVLDALRNTLPGVARECENALVELALEVAQKLVAGLPITSSMIEAEIHEAMAQVESGTEFHVQLNPDDLALLQQVNSPLLLPTGGSGPIHFQSSSEVTRGGCLVKTRFGIIDTRRETKLELLKNSIQP